MRWFAAVLLLFLVLAPPAVCEEAAAAPEIAVYQAYDAIDDGVTETLAAFLEQGGDPNTVGDEHVSLLQAAVIARKPDMVKLLLDHGADPDRIEGTHFVYPLLEAVSNGLDDMVQMLRAAGAETTLLVAAAEGDAATVRRMLKEGTHGDLNVSQGANAFPLYWAARGGHVDVIRQLLRRGASPATRTDNGLTALSGAVLSDNEAAVRVLVRAGAEVEARVPDTEMTPLHQAAYLGLENSTKALIRASADIEAQDKVGGTPLMYAAFNRRFGVVKQLIEAGADVNVRDNKGQTAFYLAAINGWDEIVPYLVEHGADITVRDNEGWTPLYRSVQYSALTSIKYLLEQGADPNVPNTAGSYPIQYAVALGSEEQTQLFLTLSEPNLEVTDREGRSPLFYAVKTEDARLTQMLLDKGADLSRRDALEITPLFFAAGEGVPETAALLLDRGADVNARAADQRTPLFWAVLANKPDMVTLLLQRGARVDVEDKLGKTPLAYAREKEFSDVVAVLEGAAGGVTAD